MTVKFGIHKVDARKIDTVISSPVVDVTITSPPYFDLKDYGYPEQIGYGQSYEEYLDDLCIVFEKVFRVTKDSGTLWVIIDMFRKDNVVVPLPFDFSNKLSEIGWKLQEVIIWGKDRTVPWVHHGQVRNLFEYILVFSKSMNFKFDIDKVRDFESLKKWWVKYPERYNPKGKTPDAIWKFDIPTQGSWGNGYIKHFCPLPEELIEQILKLTTVEENVVLDPFAGSGAVLAKADNMKRKYIGFELNHEYIAMFENYLKETGHQKRSMYEAESQNVLPQQKFEKLILDLRGLKYARTLLVKLIEDLGDEFKVCFVEPWVHSSTKKHVLIRTTYRILHSGTLSDNEILTSIKIHTKKAPLSKYGIDPEFILYSDSESFYREINHARLFTYTVKNTHKFVSEIRGNRQELESLSKREVVLSPIKVDLEEGDYE